MTDLLLAKAHPDEGFLDLSIGEAHITRNNLFSYFPSLNDPTILSLGHDLSLHDFEYLPPAGLKELVKLLEDKHQAPCVVFNGAKQALGASFYALKKRGISDLYMQPIHWALLPPMATYHGLDVRYAEPNKWHRFDSDEFRTAYLLVAPNNPNGECPSPQELKEWEQHYQERKMPLIFDGAYYTHSYLPSSYQLHKNIGSLQIYSFSKALGLSSIRGGYCVVNDNDFYYDMIAYQEMMTVGVSVFTQKYLYNILKKLQQHPKAAQQFEEANFNDLRAAKKMLKEVPKSILEVPENIEESNGMFAFCKVNNIEAFNRAKIYVVSGKPFGDNTKIRINLGVEPEILKECVKRLQEVG